MFHREYSKAFHFIYELWSGVLPQHANIILILFSVEIDRYSFAFRYFESGSK